MEDLGRELWDVLYQVVAFDLENRGIEIQG